MITVNGVEKELSGAALSALLQILDEKPLYEYNIEIKLTRRSKWPWPNLRKVYLGKANNGFRMDDHHNNVCLEDNNGYVRIVNETAE